LEYNSSKFVHFCNFRFIQDIQLTNKYIKRGSKESISEEYKKADQSLHQLFGCIENSLFSGECNKMNKNKHFDSSIRILINLKYKSKLHK